MDDDDEVETVDVRDFDRGTRIARMRSGALHLTLPAMPPSWSNGRDGPWESFAEHLSTVLGVEVEGVDKEMFVIASPPSDGLARLCAHLRSLRR